MAKGNENAPHSAVIWLTVEVHERMPTGELSGDPVHKDKKVFAIDGADRFVAIRKLNELLEELKKCCRQA